MMEMVNKLAELQKMTKKIRQAFTFCFHVTYLGMVFVACLFPLLSFAQATVWSEEMTDQLEKMGMLHVRALETEKHKIKQEIVECDGASKSLVEALRSKGNRKGKQLQNIKIQILLIF